MVARLRTHAQSLAKLVQTRKAVLKNSSGDPGSGGEGHHARETLETAERDELGLLVLQRQIIQGAQTRGETLAGLASERQCHARGARSLRGVSWRCPRAHALLTPSLLARADQDEQLDDLARVVTNTRHIALAVNDELDLHARLLVRACVVSLGGGCRHAC